MRNPFEDIRVIVKNHTITFSYKKDILESRYVCSEMRPRHNGMYSVKLCSKFYYHYKLTDENLRPHGRHDILIKKRGYHFAHILFTLVKSDKLILKLLKDHKLPIYIKLIKEQEDENTL